MPCKECIFFSVPVYDYEEGYFLHNIEACALIDIMRNGDDFIGYKIGEVTVN